MTKVKKKECDKRTDLDSRKTNGCKLLGFLSKLQTFLTILNGRKLTSTNGRVLSMYTTIVKDSNLSFSKFHLETSRKVYVCTNKNLPILCISLL